MKKYLKSLFHTKKKHMNESNKNSVADCEKSLQYMKDGPIYCGVSGCKCQFKGVKHMVIRQNESIDKNEYCEIVVAYKKGFIDGMCEMENKKLCKHFCIQRKIAMYGKCSLTGMDCTSTPDVCNLNRIYNDGYTEGLLSKKQK